MDRDFIRELFSEFGAVDLRRMFSGYGISANGINFALVLRGGIYLRADTQTQEQFQEENSKPFQYEARGKLVIVKSYWALPARLYDDPADLAGWARAALAAAERAKAAKPVISKRPKTAKAEKAQQTKSRTKAVGASRRPRVVKKTALKKAVSKKAVSKKKKPPGR